MRMRRKALAMSQSDLAERARMGSRTVRAAEQGNAVSADTAMQISVTLGIPYVLLVRKTPEEVHARLLERGYAPLEAPRPWMPRPELEPILELFGGDEGAMVLLEGPVGIGKSSAARWITQEIAEQFPDGAVWFTAAKLDEPGRLHRLQRDVAGCLGMSELLPDADLVTTEAFDRAFATRLWSRRRLLVLDDVRDAEHVRRLLDPDVPHWVLITTSSRYVAEQLDGHRCLLQRWEPEIAENMLREVIDDGRMTADPEGAKDLAEHSGGLPLVVRNIADTLRRRRYTAPSDYAAELSSAGLEGLGHEEHVRIGALYVFQDRPFSLPFARVATGLSEIGTRLLLEQLSDLYLLREAPTVDTTDKPVPRFVLDSASRGIAFWDSQESRRAMDRLIAAGPELAEEISGEVWGQGTSPAGARRIDVELPVWRLILDEASRRITGPELTTARSPDEVPQVMQGAERPPLAQTLRNLRSLLLYQPPDDAGQWVTSALAAAVDLDNADDIRDAHWMMMVWWWLGRQRFEEATNWCESTIAVAQRTGPPERVLTARLFAAGLLRYSRGRVAARRHFEAAAAIDDTALAPHQRACALGCLGAAVFQDGEAERAEQLTLDALEALGDAEAAADLALMGELTLNLAVIQMVRGQQPDTPAQVSSSVRAVMRTFAGSTLLEAQILHLAQMLGVDVGIDIPTASQAFYGVPPALLSSRLLRLMQTLIDLGQPVEDSGYDGGFDTPLGRFSLITTPFAPREGGPAMAMLLIAPIEPLRRMLTGPGLRAALEFCDTIYGADHPTYRALIALGKRG
ncbi:MAG: helix-turn-helix domain-containing protein [Proteobacteria bacterium]|nr:helix-turn-helix domain-containing protein [Pseudomonadota bacterium]